MECPSRVADIAVSFVRSGPEKPASSRRARLTIFGDDTDAGLNWNLFPEGVEGWVIVASAIGPLPLSCVCRYVRCDISGVSWSGRTCCYVVAVEVSSKIMAKRVCCAPSLPPSIHFGWLSLTCAAPAPLAQSIRSLWAFAMCRPRVVSVSCVPPAVRMAEVERDASGCPVPFASLAVELSRTSCRDSARGRLLVVEPRTKTTRDLPRVFTAPPLGLRF